MSNCSDASGVVVARQLPQPFQDGTNDELPIRGGRYREAYTLPVLPDFKVAADEGSFYTGTNAVFGTGVAGPSSTAFSATTAIFSLFNKAGNNGVRTYLAYIRLILTAAAGSSTSFEFGVTEDSIARGSAGTAVTLTNPNQDASTNNPVTQVLYTPTVAAASNAARNVARAKGKPSIGVVGDELLLVFGSVEMAGAIISSGTAGRYVVPMPPVIIGPGNLQSALVHLWSPGAAGAPSFEFEIGLIER